MSTKRISVLNLCHVLKPFVKSTPGLQKHESKERLNMKRPVVTTTKPQTNKLNTRTIALERSVA